MKNDNYYRIIEKAQRADEVFANNHLKAFVNTFVIKTKKDRWSELLCKRPSKIFQMSHRLEESLDERFCFPIKELHEYVTEKKGLYYDFLDSPLCITGNNALTLGENNDAIFSITSGRLALLFSHEGRIWECRKE